MLECKSCTSLKEEVAYLKEQLNLSREDRLIGEEKHCKSCDTLKQQLEFTNNEKSEMVKTLIQLTRPSVVVPSGETRVLDKVPSVGGMFSRRRAVLEDMHKKREEVVKSSPFIAKVGEMDRASVKNITEQSVAELEQKLGVVDEKGNEVNAS